MTSDPRPDALGRGEAFQPAGTGSARYCILATVAGVALPAAAAIAVVGWAKAGRLGATGWRADLLVGVLAVVATVAVAELAQAAWRHWSLPGPGLADFLPHRWVQRQEALRWSRELLGELGSLPAGVSPRATELLAELATTLAATDPYQRGRPERRAERCAELAQELGLPEDQSGRLQLAALLQDIGLAEIPAELPDRQGALAEIPAELPDRQGALAEGDDDVARRHPARSAALIAPWVEPEVAAAVYSHHEHSDGGGYPEGLAGEQIPALAALLAVVDSYEALVSDRPHRRRLSPAEAARELRDMAGTELAEAAVGALLAIVGRPSWSARALWAGTSPAISRLRHAARGSAAPLTAGIAVLIVGLAAWGGELSAGPATVAAVVAPQASPAAAPSPAPTPQAALVGHAASPSSSPPGAPAPTAAADSAGSGAGGSPSGAGPNKSPNAKSPGSGATAPRQSPAGKTAAPSTLSLPGPQLIQTPPGSGSPKNPAPAPAGTPPTSSSPVPAPSPSLAGPPGILFVTPITGPAAGGTTVTINGSGFTGATAVTFGSAPASFQVKSDTVITAVSPPGNGIVLIKVTTPAGTSTSLLNLFTYTGGGLL